MRTPVQRTGGSLEADDENEPAGAADEEEGGRVKVVAAVRTVLPTRWQTRVFAVACVRHIIQVCCEARPVDNPHTDVAAARRHPHGDFLVLRLNEIIRTCFIAATSTVDQLRQVSWTEMMPRLYNGVRHIARGCFTHFHRRVVPSFMERRRLAWKRWKLSSPHLLRPATWILMAITAF